MNDQQGDLMLEKKAYEWEVSQGISMAVTLLNQ